MNARLYLAIAVLTACSSLTACGGEGGAPAGTLPSMSGGTTQSVTQQTDDAIEAANGIGSPLKDVSSYEDTTSSPLQSDSLQGKSASQQIAGNGTCTNGVESFAPDKGRSRFDGTHLLLRQRLYGDRAGCRARLESTSASSESVARTVSLYGLNSSSPEAERSETVNYTNASFDRDGYPIVKNGFDRTHTGELDINGVKTIDGDGDSRSRRAPAAARPSAPIPPVSTQPEIRRLTRPSAGWAYA